MHILKDRNVIVKDRHVVTRVHHEGVVLGRVATVMAQGGDKTRHDLKGEWGSTQEAWISTGALNTLMAFSSVAHSIGLNLTKNNDALLTWRLVEASARAPCLSQKWMACPTSTA